MGSPDARPVPPPRCNVQLLVPAAAVRRLAGESGRPSTSIRIPPITVIRMRSIQHATASSIASIVGGEHELLLYGANQVILTRESPDEHGGFVRRAAFVRAIWRAARPPAACRSVLYALDFDEHASFPLEA